MVSHIIVACYWTHLAVDYLLPFFHIPLFKNEGFISLLYHHLVG